MTKKTSTPTNPPGEPRYPRVVGEHQEDRERAQALDVAAEARTWRGVRSQILCRTDRGRHELSPSASRAGT
jgi:hypothetical protein